MPMQYAALFNNCKNDNFQIKNENAILFILNQNIDCGFMLDVVSN